MRFSELGAVAALGAVGQAFLLPPTISSSDDDVVHALPYDQAVDIEGRLIEISCPGCPVEITTLDGETKTASADVESVLRFNFSLTHNDIDQLMLNDVQVYPIDPTSQTFMDPLIADQLVNDGESWNYAASPKLGYSLSLRHPATDSDNEQMNLVSLHLEIVEVAGTFVSGIPAIDVQLLETPSGKLMIGNAEIIPAQAPTSDISDGEQECTTILCKWRAIVAEKLSKLKTGCMGKMGKAPQAQAEPQVAAEPISSHHAHPHRPHRHHHTHSGFGRFLRGVVFHVFIPILIGVCVGITASLVGMIVGHLAIFLWRIIFRRGQTATYHQVEQEDVAKEDEDDETKAFMEHQSPPPSYEEAPAYEEAVVDEKSAQ